MDILAVKGFWYTLAKQPAHLCYSFKSIFISDKEIKLYLYLSIIYLWYYPAL